jgi:hypothetical protein
MARLLVDDLAVALARVVGKTDFLVEPAQDIERVDLLCALGPRGNEARHQLIQLEADLTQLRADLDGLYARRPIARVLFRDAHERAKAATRVARIVIADRCLVERQPLLEQLAGFLQPPQLARHATGIRKRLGLDVVQQRALPITLVFHTPSKRVADGDWLPKRAAHARVIAPLVFGFQLGGALAVAGPLQRIDGALHISNSHE